MKPLSRWALLAAVAAGALFSAKNAFADRDALWRIVHTQCVPAAAKGDPLPPPCLKVDGPDAVIKDRVGVAQLLDIPTAKVTGIEDPQLLAPGAPNHFAAAWKNRGLMDRYLKVPPPPAGISIAVNSSMSRSQDQLHLHIDCLRPDVFKTLTDYAPHVDNQWRPMTDALAGRKYWIRSVDDLETADPFRLLADEMPGAKANMGQWSLAAAPLGKSFALLADVAELTAGGHAEDLQDHDCAVVR